MPNGNDQGVSIKYLVPNHAIMGLFDTTRGASSIDLLLGFNILRALGVICLVTAIVCLILFLNSRYQSARANEWLLVIKDGKLKKAGVGIKEFVLPGETIVKFPSRVERVEFKAMNITVEMQGISIEGFAFWTVDRIGEGPFKCFKYMSEGNANEHVRTLCESIVRNEIANFKLNEVIKNRDLLKEKIKTELAPQLRGWGIWLETVELTDVKICSKTVFEDLQAQYRMETNLKANSTRLQASTRTTLEKIASEIKMQKSLEENTTQKKKSTLQQELKRKEQEITYFQQNSDMEIKKLNQDKLLDLENKKTDHLVALAEQKNNHESEAQSLQVKLQGDRQSIEMDKMHTPMSLKKHKVDLLTKMHYGINFNEIKLNQFVPEDRKANLFAIVPGFADLMEEQL